MSGLLFVIVGSLFFVGSLVLIEAALRYWDERNELSEIEEPLGHVRIRPRPFDYERDWDRN